MRLPPLRTALPRAAAPLRSESGFIVLGLLLLVVVGVVAGVLVGKVVHAGRYPYEVPLGHRELRIASGVLEVRYGAVVTRQLRPGEGVWVRPVREGLLAVFEGKTSPRVIGFVSEPQLPHQAGSERRESAQRGRASTLIRPHLQPAR